MSETFTGKRRMWPTPRSTIRGGGIGCTMETAFRGMEKHGYKSHLEQAIASECYPVNAVSPVSQQLTLFAEAFPANPTVSLANETAVPTSATSGESSPESFAKLDRAGCWRKMCRGFYQPNLDGSLDEYCETWPRAGMTWNGTAFLRVPLAPLTGEIESGSWPTPRNCTAMAATFTENTPLAKFPNLKTVVAQRLWPTTSQELNGALNPTWVEWLMGYPIGWTVLEDWGTASSRKSRSGSVAGSSRPTKG